ncbi:hypothetical protein HDU97_000245 [Phlyctochytrium planicorne]|nr:hypothetical protein HDU97_000245 [Phlyctochytrium planicorne]
MPLSKTIAQQSNLKNFAITAVACFAAVSVLRRTNWLLFGSSKTSFAFNPDFDLTFGYTGEAVIEAIGASGLSYFGRLIALIGAAVNIIHIASFAGLSAIIITEGLRVGGDATKNFQRVNQIPLVSASIHLIETLVFLMAVNAGSAGLASIAGALNRVRSAAAYGNLLSLVASIPILAQDWSKGIGRDGRQRIEVEKKKE